MLNKKNKIQKKKEVENVFKNGKSSFDKFLGLKVIKTENKINRFVIVVSAKVSKKAVKRNYIKRRLHEIARLNLRYLDQGHDFFVLALPPIIEKNFSEIENLFIAHCKKLKAISPKTHNV